MGVRFEQAKTLSAAAAKGNKRISIDCSMAL